MSSRPDDPVINDPVINDPNVKKAVEDLKKTINQVLTEKGNTELDNNKIKINKQCKKFFIEYTNLKTPEDKEQMIATEKKKLQLGVESKIFNKEMLDNFLNPPELRPDQQGGYPGDEPSATQLLTSLVVVCVIGAFAYFSTPEQFIGVAEQLIFQNGYNAVLGGSKHKKRKGRKSKKTKKSMKHKKGRKSKKAKKSMKKKKGRKSMKKKKSNKKRK